MSGAASQGPAARGERSDRRRCVALVGLPGSGKTAVGSELARRLGWGFLDTDWLVEAQAGRSVDQIFASEGEAGFRQRELAALAAVLRSDPPASKGPLVLACGGGLVTTPEALSMLLRGAVVVWIDAPDEALLQRLAGERARPLLRDDPPRRLADLRRARGAAYAAAHIRVDAAAGDAAAVAGRTVESLSELWPELGGGVRVELGARAYNVDVRAGAIDAVAARLPEASHRVAVVADRAVGHLGRRVAAAVRASDREATLIGVGGGERLKTWAAAGRLVGRLAGLGLERTDCVVAVGGGTVGDVAGFAAAVYLRGVAIVQVPTTLLAMVDSGLGGKTGVNLRAGKNLAGAFWQPHAVVCDPEVLSSIPERAWRAAFAEIVKYAMILDAGLGDLLDGGLPALLARDPDSLTAVVARCCGLKASVVAGDERESGRRALLNYGHTIGHALESATGYGELLHGEAVAAGMAVAGLLSTRRAGCPQADLDWQRETLASCGLRGVPRLDVDRLVELTRGDKKSRRGRVRWVLVERRGAASFGHLVPEDEVRQACVEALPWAAP